MGPLQSPHQAGCNSLLLAVAFPSNWALPTAWWLGASRKASSMEERNGDHCVHMARQQVKRTEWRFNIVLFLEPLWELERAAYRGKMCIDLETSVPPSPCCIVA